MLFCFFRFIFLFLFCDVIVLVFAFCFFIEFHNLQVSNVEIGPSSRYVYLNGMYNLARMELPILRSAVEEYGNEEVNFDIPKVNGKRRNTFEDLYDRLIKQMDYAFDYVYKGVSYDESYSDYTEFLKAIELFVNPNGISPHAVVYGAVFRPRGASIQNFGRLLSQETKSSDLLIDNLEIHDLSVDVKEYFAMQGKTERWIRDPINGVLPISDVSIGFDHPLDDLVYVGNAWTDIIIGLKKVSSSWWHLGRMAMSDDIANWATSGERLGIFYKTESISTPRYCNMDALGHLVKGMLGIRMEWVDGVKVNNLNIHDLFALSAKGNDELCGEYVGTGHPVQSAYSNPGYGGINNYGVMMYEVTDAILDTVSIDNLVSYNGPTFGLKQFKLTLEEGEEGAAPDVTLRNVEMSNFFAGAELTGTDGKQASWPNAAARACGLMETDEFYVDSSDSPQVSCLSGKTTCSGCDGNTCFGDYSTCDSVPSIATPYHSIHFKMGEFDMEEIDTFVSLSIDSESRPDILNEMVENEPTRMETEEVEDSHQISSILFGNILPKHIDTDYLVEEEEEESELTLNGVMSKKRRVVTLLDKQATWIGLAIIVVTFSVLILYAFMKFETGQFKWRKDLNEYATV